MGRRAALLAAAIAAALSTTSAAHGAALQNQGWLQLRAVDAHALELCLMPDDEHVRVVRWTIRMARGTTAPPPRQAPTATVRARCRRIGRLERDVPYTFLVVARDASGRVTRDVATAAARDPGAYVTRPGRAPQLLPGGRSRVGAVALATTGPQREIAAAYIRGGSGDRPTELVISRRGSASAWSQPEFVSAEPSGGSLNAVGFSLAGNARGDALTTWSQIVVPPLLTDPWPLAAYSLRPAGATAWGETRRLFAQLEAAAIDDTGHLHFLLRESPPARYALDKRHWELIYATDATGRWTETIVPGAACRRFEPSRCTPALLANDAAADRLVLVEHHTERRTAGGGPVPYDVIRVAGKRTAAEAFQPAHEIVARRCGIECRKDDGRLLPASVASHDGQITVALRRLPGWQRSRARGAGLYIMSGADPARVSGLTRVPGTTIRDAAGSGPRANVFNRFLVSAPTRNRAVLAWQRDTVWSPSWDIREQGLWTAGRVRDRDTGAWRFTTPQHATSSAYDVLDSLVTGPGGGAVLGFHRWERFDG